MTPIAATVETKTTARRAGEDVTVLIVDDQAVFRRVAREVVAATPGFTPVAEAESGEKAIWLVAEASPALVLLDVRLPGMDGVEAARQISASHPEVSIVLITADDLERLPEDPLSCGAFAAIRKQDFGPSVLRSLWAGHRPSVPRQAVSDAQGRHVGARQDASPP